MRIIELLQEMISLRAKLQAMSHIYLADGSRPKLFHQTYARLQEVQTGIEVERKEEYK